jgi:hypothetical protein
MYDDVIVYGAELWTVERGIEELLSTALAVHEEAK